MFASILFFYSIHLYSAFSIVKDQMTFFRHHTIRHEKIQRKAAAYRWVSRLLKSGKLVAKRIDTGRSFHSLGVT